MISTANRIDYLSGWRFLFSKKFRNDTNERWREQHPALTVMEVTGSVITAAAALIAVSLAAVAIWSLLSG